MTDCTHRVLVLGTTLKDAGECAERLVATEGGEYTIVSFRNLHLQLRGHSFSKVRVSNAALDDERLPAASFAIRQAIAWHAACDCDGTHPDCRGCGTAVEYVRELDVVDNVELAGSPYLQRIGVVGIIGWFLILALVLGISFGVIPL